MVYRLGVYGGDWGLPDSGLQGDWGLPDSGLQEDRVIGVRAYGMGY